jgi:hypothetical protein
MPTNDSPTRKGPGEMHGTTDALDQEMHLTVLPGRRSNSRVARTSKMEHTGAVEDAMRARDQLARLPAVEDRDPDDRAEYDAGEWLAFMISDLGRLAEAIQAHHWSDADRTEMRRAAVTLAGRTLGFVEQLDDDGVC